MVNSRSLDDLDPRVKDLCNKFIQACADSAEKTDILITSTYRDNDCQQALYQQGRAVPGTIVTNAKPGYSVHQYRLAFDFAPIVNGKIPWGDSSLFQHCGEIAESVGLEWAGRWTGSMRELAHCQQTFGLTIQDLLAGKRP